MQLALVPAWRRPGARGPPRGAGRVSSSGGHGSGLRTIPQMHTIPNTPQKQYRWPGDDNNVHIASATVLLRMQMSFVLPNPCGALGGTCPCRCRRNVADPPACVAQVDDEAITEHMRDVESRMSATAPHAGVPPSGMSAGTHLRTDLATPPSLAAPMRLFRSVSADTPSDGVPCDRVRGDGRGMQPPDRQFSQQAPGIPAAHSSMLHPRGHGPREPEVGSAAHPNAWNAPMHALWISLSRMLCDT